MDEYSYIIVAMKHPVYVRRALITLIPFPVNKLESHRFSLCMQLTVDKHQAKTSQCLFIFSSERCMLSFISLLPTFSSLWIYVGNAVELKAPAVCAL